MPSVGGVMNGSARCSTSGFLVGSSLAGAAAAAGVTDTSAPVAASTPPARKSDRRSMVLTSGS